jgi:LacI family transcriptional regulator
VVFFDRICESIPGSCITTDDFEGGFAATEHLILCKCKKIAYLDLSRHLSISSKRMQGYVAALNKHNIHVDERLIMQFSNDVSANEEVITDALDSSDRPDGIFASVEKLAIASYNVCEKLKINIPEQVKIIGFSNLEISSLLNPSLSTITQPAYEIGKQAALQLLRYLEKKNMTDVHETIILKSTLIPRGSTKVTSFK